MKWCNFGNNGENQESVWVSELLKPLPKSKIDGQASMGNHLEFISMTLYTSRGTSLCRGGGATCNRDR